MKLNMKVRYAMACLIELSTRPHEFRDAESLAKSQSIPPAYTQKVLQRLAQTGFVFGTKGLGYKLTRSLADISALDVIHALDGEEAPNEATSPAARALEKKLEMALGALSLQDVCSEI